MFAIYKILKSSLLLTTLLCASFIFNSSTLNAQVELPEFVKNIKTNEDLESLTPEQIQEMQEALNSFNPSASIVTNTEPAGNLNCFDYYSFGSVQVSVMSQVEGTVSGSPITFTGTIDNNNTYPIVDGAVYMKVFRLSNDDDLPVNGYDVVWQGFVAENINLIASSSESVELSWQVPSALITGNYQATFYFTSAKSFNLQGLLFTDDVVGNTINFSVAGELEKSVFFDKDSVKVAGEDYYFNAFTPKVSPNEPIEVSASLINDTINDLAFPVTITTYAWDQQRKENIIDTKETVVSVPAGAKTAIQHVVTDNSNSVYLVVFESQYLDSQSFLNVRFTRQNIPSTRINFPAVTNYPLVAGEETTLFSCLHSAGTMDVVKDGRLELNLTDNTTNQSFHSYTYEGDVTGVMMAAGEIFTPAKSYDNFTLNAKLYSGNKLVEEFDMVYDCKNLRDECNPVIATNNETGNSSSSSVTAQLLTLLILIALGLLTFVWNKKRNSKNIPSNQSKADDMVGPLVLLLLLIPTMFFVSTSTAEAKSKVVNFTSSTPYWYYQQTAQDWASGGWIVGLQSPNVNVGYNANVYNHDTNALISEGSVVPVGTKLRFTPSRGAISWNGTGHTVDTPTGSWVGGAVYPYTTGTAYYSGETYRTGQCKAQDFVSYSSFISGLKIHIPLSVNPGSMSVNLSGSTAGLASLGGNVYQVTSPGSINATFNYGSTYGRFYYEYYLPSSVSGGPVCRTSWDRLPMRNTPAYSPISFMFAVVSSPSNVSLGNFWIPATNITYNLTANNPNNPPNVPTITNNAANNYLAGSAQGFTISGSDPDGNNIRFIIDWDMNGTYDQYTTYVSSGGSRNVSHNWATAGSKTFRARAQDTNGGLSGWRNHTITLAEPVPTLSMNATHNSTNYPQGSTITIDAYEEVTLSWSSTWASSCTASGGWSGTKGTAGTNVAITEPGPGSSATYSLSCTGPGGTSPTRSITITTNTPANLTTPQINFTNTGGFDPITGNYLAVNILFGTSNNGGSLITTDSIARIRLDEMNDGIFEDSANVTVFAPIAPAATTPTLNHTFTDIPFGDNRVEVTVDSTNLITEGNETDNTDFILISLAPQANLSITVDEPIVDIGEETTLRWDTGVSFAMNCEVHSAAGIINSFDPSVDGSSGNALTGPVQGETEYILTCVEPITNSTFEESVKLHVSSIMIET